MTGRPRAPHGGGTDDGGTPPGRRDGDGTGPRPPAAGSVAQAQQAVAQVAQQGRPTARGGGNEPPVPASHPDDVRLAELMNVYERLGDEPPEFNVGNNDAVHGADGAHTIDRHGSNIPLRRDPNAKTIEGRIYGDHGWERPDNWSLRWTDPTTMNREINNYVRRNWEEIRTNLAFDGSHTGAFDAGHRVGDGFFNNGMYGARPRQAQYTAASLVRISIDLVPGSDPPQAFIVTAFPAGTVPFGLL